MKRDNIKFGILFILAAIGVTALEARPMREWDWHMPGAVYKDLDFTERAGVDRAVKIFQQAVDAEDRGAKPMDLVPRYRAAAGEWRKVQVQSETGGGDERLLAYAVFMQGYSRMQARDRNEAIKLFNEVLDLYESEKFIAVPARYMLSRVKREMGDVKKADADLDEIIDDKAADGHIIFYNVLRDRAGVYWSSRDLDSAAELWQKIVYTTGKPDGNLWRESRSNLIVALIALDRYDELEKALFAGIPEAGVKKRTEALAENAGWMFDCDTYWHHGVTRWLDVKYTDGENNATRHKNWKKRESESLKIRKAYAAWFDGEQSKFEGYDDGFAFAYARFRAHARIEKPAWIAAEAKKISGIVSGTKEIDKANGRARALAMTLAALRDEPNATAAAELAKTHPYKLILLYDVRNSLGKYKEATMYLEEYCGLQPEPTDRKGRLYDLAWMYRHRLGDNEKAVKVYDELNDPPRSLWGKTECLRACGKKKESYSVLTELVSMFPGEAAEAVLRMAHWKAEDGEKEKAIGLYKQLLKHPEWKKSRASSEAHQALERYGVLTGGAMTNEVR